MGSTGGSAARCAYYMYIANDGRLRVRHEDPRGHARAVAHGSALQRGRGEGGWGSPASRDRTPERHEESRGGRCGVRDRRERRSDRERPRPLRELGGRRRIAAGLPNVTRNHAVAAAVSAIDARGAVIARGHIRGVSLATSFGGSGSVCCAMREQGCRGGAKERERRRAP